MEQLKINKSASLLIKDNDDKYQNLIKSLMAPKINCWYSTLIDEIKIFMSNIDIFNDIDIESSKYNNSLMYIFNEIPYFISYILICDEDSIKELNVFTDWQRKRKLINSKTQYKLTCESQDKMTNYDDEVFKD